MTNKEFSRVIERLQRKDIGALKILYEQCFQRIYKTAYGIVKNKDDAYDVAMGVIMELIGYSSDPYQIQNYVGFLITMTKNKALDRIRKESHHMNNGTYAVTAAVLSDDNLWIDDILNVLTGIEKDIFIEHCIWDKTLKAFANDRGLSYITVKRAYAVIKSKIKYLYR